MWDRRARLVSVTDGDTLKLVLDQGYGDTKTLHARLADAHAPERGQAGHYETTRFVVFWLANRGGDWPLVATSRRVRADTHEVTTVGRYVFDVTDRAGESLTEAVNAFVAREGYPTGY